MGTASEFQQSAPERKPLTDEQKREFVAGYFSENWSIMRALEMLDDYDQLIGVSNA